ncbi:MAG TPA: hypothetical protein VGR51_10190 [Thermoplasmata archaeon]|jgi:hypothetical protein|nr:hypothetical protein [Thermoplasmata archaeon]
MRTVFLVDLAHRGQIPQDLEALLGLLGWNTLRPGIAYILDWETAIHDPFPGGVWDRIVTVVDMARDVGLRHRFLTMRRGEKIPLMS